MHVNEDDTQALITQWHTKRVLDRLITDWAKSKETMV